jgi:purine catabolism regulator
MRLRQVLQLDSLRDATVVAGVDGLDREIRWAHVVDMPGPAPWVTRDQLLLTTGYAWPHEAEAERRQVAELAERGLSAIGLAVPGYVEHFSDVARAAAEEQRLTLIEIPWDVPFARITEELHRCILASQQAAIERSEEIHRSLTRAASEGTSLQGLARRLGELIDRSVTIEDPGGKLLAHHTAGAADDPARRETLAATQSPSSLLSALARLGHLERIRASSEPVRIPAIAEVGLSARVVCPIRLGGEIAGFVWIMEGHAPLSDLDHRAAEHAALVAALQISHQRELAQLESRLGYASFLSLLEAPTGATPQALERARLLGFDPDVVYRVGIIVFEEPLPLAREAVLRRDQIMERLRRALVQVGVARPMLGAMLNLMPFLVPESVAVDRLVAGLDGEPVRFVFGRAYGGTEGVRTSYREARSLVDYDGRERVARYEEVLVPRVLLGDARARASFLEQLLGPLAARRGGIALRQAVLAYADEGFHFRRTAERLRVHPNTLRYRLERAREATGLSFEDPEIRFRLQLANRLISLDVRSKARDES